jgi:hypothetical protein
LQGLVFKGRSDFYFISEILHFDFENLRARPINGNTLNVKIGDSALFFTIKNRALSPIKIPLQDFSANFNFDKLYQKTITLSARMFNGHCYSRIFLDTAFLPWQIKGQGNFKGLNINQGLFSGNFKLQSSHGIELSGILTEHHGNFNNTPFQAWLARTLQMPSLEHLSGADLSCRFKINGNSKMLDDLKLKTEDINLSGSFHLDADDLVSSQGSVQFSQKLLDESPIGLHILRLVQGGWTLPFEFHLSGDVHRVNFQWDKSSLKDKLRQHLFSFIERTIDRRIDAHPTYKVTIPNESVSPG